MRKIAWLMAILLTAASSFAGAAPVKGGVKGGLSFANFTGDTDILIAGIAIGGYDADFDVEVDNSIRTGLAIGGFVGIPAGNNLVIQPEMYYVQKGMKGKGRDSDGFGNGTITAEYIEIPVLLKFNIGTPGAKAMPNLFVGPALAMKLGAELKVTTDDGDTDITDIEEGLNSTDLGLVLGFGVDVDKLTFDLRYVMGLTSIADTGGADVDFSIKNSVFMLMAGYAFN